jgi:hypothetical protein
MDIYLFQRSSDERSHCLQAESRITGNPCVCDNQHTSPHLDKSGFILNLLSKCDFLNWACSFTPLKSGLIVKTGGCLQYELLALSLFGILGRQLWYFGIIALISGMHDSYLDIYISCVWDVSATSSCI